MVEYKKIPTNIDAGQKKNDKKAVRKKQKISQAEPELKKAKEILTKDKATTESPGVRFSKCQILRITKENWLRKRNFN